MINPKLMLSTGKAFLSMNSPAILTGLGITGVVATAFSTGKAVWSLRDVPFDVTLKDIKEQGLWKRFIIPVTIAGGTILCFIGINNKYGRILAAVTSMATLREQELLDTKSAMSKILKKGDIEKIDQEKAKSLLARNPQPDESFIIHTGKGHDLFFDDLSGLYFRCDMQTIDNVVNTINATLLHNQTLRVSEVYEGWGFGQPPEWSDHIWMVPEQDIGYPYRQLEISHSQAHVTTKGEAAVIIKWPDDIWESGFFQPETNRPY